MSAGRASLCRGSGLLDQVISLFGRADRMVFFDCRSEEIRTVPFPPSLALIIARSGKKRDLASSHYNLRREQTRAATQLLGVPALRDATLARLRQSEQFREQHARAPIFWFQSHNDCPAYSVLA